MPARVIMQDLTGVPAVVDLAAMRDAVARHGGSPAGGSAGPVDLVIDQSVQVDAFGSSGLPVEHRHKSSETASAIALLRGAGSVRQLPRRAAGYGIVHQVNMEYWAGWCRCETVWRCRTTLVGTDSHTTMINALGVLGWGVGGIEAEAAMLGQPLYLTSAPETSEYSCPAKLGAGVTATDLVLTLTEALGGSVVVVGSFVEFFGTGLDL